MTASTEKTEALSNYLAPMIAALPPHVPSGMMMADGTWMNMVSEASRKANRAREEAIELVLAYALVWAHERGEPHGVLVEGIDSLVRFRATLPEAVESAKRLIARSPKRSI